MNSSRHEQFAHSCQLNVSVYPQSKGQCEKYNDVIWPAVKLALKTKNQPTCQWESVLPEALHSVRSILCTATYATPHERFFNVERCPALGSSVPTWLRSPGRVFLKRNIRSSKYEPLVDEAELIHATPSYAHVRLRNGRETTVSLRDITPITRGNTFSNELHSDPVDRHTVEQSALNVSSNAKKTILLVTLITMKLLCMMTSIILLCMMLMTLLHLNRPLEATALRRS